MANNADLLGEEAALRQIITNDFSATEGRLEDSDTTSARKHALRGKTNLKYLSLPNLGNANESCFNGCTNLEEVYLPRLSQFNGNSAFNTCTKLKKISLPSLTTWNGNYQFQKCTSMKMADFTVVTRLGSYGFSDCYGLVAVILRKDSVVTLIGTPTFNSTRYATNGSGGGYVYVPRDLIPSYQAATNWATLYAAHPDMFRPLEDYTVDGTTTGEFDESLISA